jgi:hypothetical protein
VADATRIVRSCRGCQFYARRTHLPAQTLQTIPITWPFVVWGLDLVGPLQKAPEGFTNLLVAIDKFSKWIEVRPLTSIGSEQGVAFFTNIIHRFGVPNSIITDNGTQFTDKWAGGARQWHDFAGTKTKDLQRPQQVWQAVDKRTTLDGLESEDDAEPGHGLLAIFPSLWGRGHLTHGLGIRFPEDKGIRRPKQPDQPRGFIGPARRGSGHSLTTLSAISAVSATLPRPKDSAPRLPSGRFGASATTRRPRATQAYSSLGRVVHHRQNFEAQHIQAGQRSRRGLLQRLEHQTTTSLLPLKCFKSFMYLAFFTCINKV